MNTLFVPIHLFFCLLFIFVATTIDGMMKPSREMVEEIQKRQQEQITPQEQRQQQEQQQRMEQTPSRPTFETETAKQQSFEILPQEKEQPKESEGSLSQQVPQIAKPLSPIYTNIFFTIPLVDLMNDVITTIQLPRRSLTIEDIDEEVRTKSDQSNEFLKQKKYSAFKKLNTEVEKLLALKQQLRDLNVQELTLSSVTDALREKEKEQKEARKDPTKKEELKSIAQQITVLKNLRERLSNPKNFKEYKLFIDFGLVPFDIKERPETFSKAQLANMFMQYGETIAKFEQDIKSLLREEINKNKDITPLSDDQIIDLLVKRKTEEYNTFIKSPEGTALTPKEKEQYEKQYFQQIKDLEKLKVLADILSSEKTVQTLKTPFISKIAPWKLAPLSISFNIIAPQRLKAADKEKIKKQLAKELKKDMNDAATWLNNINNLYDVRATAPTDKEIVKINAQIDQLEGLFLALPTEQFNTLLQQQLQQINTMLNGIYGQSKMILIKPEIITLPTTFKEDENSLVALQKQAIKLDQQIASILQNKQLNYREIKNYSQQLRDQLQQLQIIIALMEAAKNY